MAESFDNSLQAAQVQNSADVIQQLQDEKTDLEDKLEEATLDKSVIKKDLGNRNIL